MKSYQHFEALDQALENLGFQGKSKFSPAEVEQVQAEISNMRLSYSDIPDFIGIYPTGDQLEKYDNLNKQEQYEAMARNLSRHLIRGVPLCRQDGNSISESPLYRDEILDSLLKKRDPKLFAAWREEMQIALFQISEVLCVNPLKITHEQEKGYELFLKIILAAYPFIDPQKHQRVAIPVKINNEWKLCQYTFDKLDISPQTGLLSTVLENKDRIYAYGLKPSLAGAKPLLLFMGTIFPAGQGADLANLYNLFPGTSVGEEHDLTKVTEWLTDKNDVTVLGHSKGATMAQIAAAKFPEQIRCAVAFNPAPLSSATLARLSPKWDALNNEERPNITVYSQVGDPVSYIGQGFLKGTEVVRIIPESPKTAINFAFNVFGFSIPLPNFIKNILVGYERHIHYLPGRSNTLAVRGNAEQMGKSKTREFVNDVKSVLDWVLFPYQYAALFIKLALRKVTGWYMKDYEPHTQSTRGRLIVGLIAAIAVLIVLSILFPPASLNAFVFMALLAMAATAIVPPLLEISFIVIKQTLDFAFALIHGTVTFTVGLLAAAVAGIKIGIKSAFEVEETQASSHSFLHERMSQLEEPTRRNEIPFISSSAMFLDNNDLINNEEKITKEQLVSKLNFGSLFAASKVADERHASSSTHLLDASF